MEVGAASAADREEAMHVTVHMTHDDEVTLDGVRACEITASNLVVVQIAKTFAGVRGVSLLFPAHSDAKALDSLAMIHALQRALEDAERMVLRMESEMLSQV